MKEGRDFAPTCHTSKTRLLKKTKDAHSGLIFTRANGIWKVSGTVIDLAKTNTRAARFYAWKHLDKAIGQRVTNNKNNNLRGMK